MQTVFYLIRHGDAYNPERVVYGRTPVPLTAMGKAKIHKLAQLLFDTGVRPDVLFSSPMERTRETAQTIVETFSDLPIVFDDRLQETDTAGATGLGIDYVNSYGDIYTAPSFADMGVERPEHILDRMMNIVEIIKKTYAGKTIFLVSHGDPLAFLYWKLFHPHETDIPNIKVLEGAYFLQKGTAWKVEINQAGEVISSQLII